MAALLEDMGEDRPLRASDWLLLLNDAPDDPELRRAFEIWLGQDAAHQREWNEVVRTYGALRRHAPALRADPAKTVSFWKRRPVRAAAGLAIAASLLILIGPQLLLHIRADRVTGTAETRIVQLADGSTLHLAPQSAVAIDVDTSRRDVRLLKGKAFFSVQPSSVRFQVTADDVTTTVVGTAFDVRLRDGAVAVGVAHGRVRVERTAGAPAVSALLGPGDTLTAAPGDPAVRRTLDAADVGAWVDGHLVVKRATVAQVVDEIRPYFRGLIILRGEELARQPITGNYRLADVDGALTAIAEAQGAQVRRISPWVIVLSMARS